MAIEWNSLGKEAQERIQAFLKVANRLRTSDLFKNGLYPLKYNISWSAVDNKMKKVLQRPPEKDVRDALYDLRKVLADREQARFYTLYNRLYCILKNQPVLDATAIEDLESVRKGFKDSLTGFASIKLGIRSCDKDAPDYLDPEDIIKLWFNGEYFHGDPDKTPRLRAMRETMGVVVEFAFLEAISDVAASVFDLEVLIQRLFNVPGD